MVKCHGEHLIGGHATCQRVFRHVYVQTCLGLSSFPENDATVISPRALRVRGVPMAHLAMPAADCLPAKLGRENPGGPPHQSVKV